VLNLKISLNLYFLFAQSPGLLSFSRPLTVSGYINHYVSSK